jgi:hypothetical protein
MPLVTHDIEVGFTVIRELGHLRTGASVVMASIPTGGLTVRLAADFAATCDQVARAVLRLVEEPPPQVDAVLRDQAQVVAYRDL